MNMRGKTLTTAWEHYGITSFSIDDAGVKLQTLINGAST